MREDIYLCIRYRQGHHLITGEKKTRMEDVVGVIKLYDLECLTRKIYKPNQEMAQMGRRFGGTMFQGGFDEQFEFAAPFSEL